MKYITIIILLFFSSQALSQLGYSKEELKGDCADMTYNYNEEIGKFYTKKCRTNNPTFFLRINYFSTNSSDNICFLEQLIFPLEDINKVVSFLNKKYVNDGRNKWKDYKKGINIEMNIYRENKVGIITKSYF